MIETLLWKTLSNHNGVQVDVRHISERKRIRERKRKDGGERRTIDIVVATAIINVRKVNRPWKRYSLSL